MSVWLYYLLDHSVIYMRCRTTCKIGSISLAQYYITHQTCSHNRPLSWASNLTHYNYQIKSENCSLSVQCGATLTKVIIWQLHNVGLTFLVGDLLWSFPQLHRPAYLWLDHYVWGYQSSPPLLLYLRRILQAVALYLAGCPVIYKCITNW